MIQNFIMTDEEYKNGVALEEYKGKYSLVRANESRSDGEVYSKWGYPQKNKAPIDTAIPWKVELGDRKFAISILKTFLAELEAGEPRQPGDENDSEIPF